MLYKEDKYSNKLSRLGFGCMRFQRNAGIIDLKEAEREILHAIELGVNYFDTAYIYPGCETAVGKVLAKNGCREKVYLASKLPPYLVKKLDDADRIFDETLSRLQTDYIDYYLMHMLTDLATWERMKLLGIEEWIEKNKRSGRIRQIGFSYHGSSSEFIRVLEAYPWDFCQIQYNYMDEHTQGGRAGLERAQELGIPVIIMEPLRGGRLVRNLPAAVEKAFGSYKVKRSPAEWSFRWLYDQAGVTVVLSGMNSVEMIDENVRVASESDVGCVTDDERDIYRRVVKIFEEKIKVGCTGCSYCMPCPAGVDIPGAFSAYNRSYSDSYFHGLREYFMGTAMRKKQSYASLCIGCGKCESHCPQQIAVRDQLKNVKKRFENPIFKCAAVVGRKLYDK
ncbi:MAG: aldo/keto reductase [Clostridia bacterium]|nr:aldo/keto reductase [Clostridia bacterium]